MQRTAPRPGTTLRPLSRLYPIKATAGLTLTLLSVLALLALTPAPASAQADDPRNWTVTSTNGYPAPINYNGWLLTGPITGTVTPTGVYQQLFLDGNDWGAFSPFSTSADSFPKFSLWLDTNANDYDGSFYHDALGNRTLIGGSISANIASTQTATLTYHPLAYVTAPPPDHVDVLLTTTLDAREDLCFDDTDFGEDDDGIWFFLSTDLSVVPIPALGATVNITDDLGDSLSATVSPLMSAFNPTGGSCNEGSFEAHPSQTVVSRHLKRFPLVNGGTQVSVAGSIVSTSSNDSNALRYPLWLQSEGEGCGTSYASAHGDLSTTVQIDNREVGITTTLDGLPQNGMVAANSDPTNRQLTGYASLNWKVQDDDSPSVPFYDGYANYFLGATGFTPTTYAWQTSQAPFVQSMATPDDLTWELPDYSVGEKHFHFDLGDDPTQFPKTTTVTGTAFGTEPYFGAFSGAATVSVTWHSPWEGAGSGGNGNGGPLSLTPAAGADVILATVPNGTAVPANTVTAGQVLLLGGQRYQVLTVQNNADGTLTFYLVPAALPPVPQDGDDILALIPEYEQRTHQVVQVGASLVGAGMQAYLTAAQIYVSDPLIEAGTAQLAEYLGKAAVLLNAGSVDGEAATYTVSSAAQVRSLAQALRTFAAEGGHTEEEVTEANQAATVLEQNAEQLDAAGYSLQSLEKRADNLAQETTELAQASDPQVPLTDAPRSQSLLPTTGPINLTPNGMPNAEIPFAQQISQFLGGAEVVGPPTSNYAGIDGWIDGNPMSLKEITTNNVVAILTDAKTAVKQARNASYTGVDLFIQANQLTVSDVIGFTGPGTALRRFTVGENQTLASITIFCQDGVIVIGG